jgi:putative colanic acid biosynthesis acetyltransferase WcaB
MFLILNIKNSFKNTKGFFLVSIFRLSAFFSRNLFLKIIGFPIRIFYKLLVQWVMGFDLPDNTKIGHGLTVFHGQGLVVHSNVVIGNNCVLRQNTTIGVSKMNGKCPVIGDNVDVGANVVIIGDIIIGDNVIIGAGSVVIKNLLSNSTYVGNPAKSISN